MDYLAIGLSPEDDIVFLSYQLYVLIFIAFLYICSKRYEEINNIKNLKKFRHSVSRVNIQPDSYTKADEKV
jgi:hypothetical protein